MFSLRDDTSELRWGLSDFGNSTLNHKAGFTAQKRGRRIPTRLIFKWNRKVAPAMLVIRCPAACFGFRETNCNIFPAPWCFQLQGHQYGGAYINDPTNTHTHTHTHVCHARTFCLCVQYLHPAGSLLLVCIVSQSDLAFRGWFLSAWPTSAGPTFHPTISQLCLARRVSGSFSITGTRQTMAVIITLQIW